MKNIITLLLVLFAFVATAQNHAGKSDMVIMDNSGTSFYLIIDDVVQNIVPKNQLKIAGIPASYHKIQLLYTSGNLINIQEQVTLLPFKQYTGFVKWKNGQKKLEWIEVANINQSSYGNNIETLIFASPHTVTCYWCTNPTKPGYHTHADGTIHANYTGNNGSNPPNGNYPPNGSNPNCYTAVPTIQPIMDELDNINFSVEKLEYLQDALANKCINSDQAYEIVESFTFDSDRVKAAKYCYDRMIDQIYANKLLDLFPYSGTRDEVRKYFTK